MSESRIHMSGSDRMVWCDVACGWVLACDCGPHEQCPEHLLNCVFGGVPGKDVLESKS
jgi:hypothetical protein